MVFKMGIVVLNRVVVIFWNGRSRLDRHSRHCHVTLLLLLHDEAKERKRACTVVYTPLAQHVILPATRYAPCPATTIRRSFWWWSRRTRTLARRTRSSAASSGRDEARYDSRHAGITSTRAMYVVISYRSCAVVADQKVSRIALTRPELASRVEDLLIRMGQSGQIRGQVNDDALKGLLQQVLSSCQQLEMS